jgi:hypothetical protein
MPVARAAENIQHLLVLKPAGGANAVLRAAETDRSSDAIDIYSSYFHIVK